MPYLTTQPDDLHAPWFDAYVQVSATTLGLSGWRIRTRVQPHKHPEDGPGDHPTYAETVFEELGECTMTLYEPALVHGAEFIRETVAHELAHVLLRPFSEAAESCENVHSRKSWAVWQHVTTDAEEGVAQHLARIFVRLLPPLTL